MTRHESRLAAARALRDRLKEQGRIDEARIVDELCRSSAASLGTNKTLHREVAVLTERLRIAKAGRTRT